MALKLDVTVPPNATGLVYVPGTDPAKVGEVGSGTPLVAGRAPGRDARRRAGRQRRLPRELRLATRSGSAPACSPPPTRPAPSAARCRATLSLTLGTPASFGAFTPGVERDYTAIDDRERDLDGG